MKPGMQTCKNDSRFIKSAKKTNMVTRCLGGIEAVEMPLVCSSLVFLTVKGGCVTSGSAQETGLKLSTPPTPLSFLRASTSKAAADSVFSALKTLR